MDGMCETMRVVTEKCEGNPHGYVVINKSEFNPDIHEEFKEDAAKPISKMTVEELTAALTEKGVEIPEGAKKADLVALMEGAK